MTVHKHKNGVLFNKDAQQVMEIMMQQNKKVQGIVTSPPYNTSKRTGASDAYNKRYDLHLDNMLSEDYVGWTIQHFRNFDKVLEKNGVILYNLSYGTESVEVANLIWETVATINKETEFCVADTITWKKQTAIPNNVSLNKLTRITEFIFVIVRKEEFKTFQTNKQVKSTSKTGQKFYENVFNYIEAKNNDGSNKLNKATYSTELVHSLLSLYFKKEDWIFDPFHGTGTTANACIEYGCNFIGSEISQEQYEFTIERINNKEW